MKIKFILFLFASFFLLDSCKINYSLSGTNISPDVHTFYVGDFPNKAQLYVPSLSETFVDKLKEKILSQTSLNQEKDASNADLIYEGEIVKYDIRPNSVSANETAATNRLTIAITVRFTNNKNHKQDWERTFSNYADVSANVDISEVEDEISNEILDKIIEDIYNNSIATW
jgi:hypothetical protein